MNIQTDRSIVFIDLETTGTSPLSDRVVELSALKINPDKTEEMLTTRINPGILIPPEAIAIHGIANDDVIDKPFFKDYAKTLKNFLDDCDFGGFNVKKFDLDFLEAEFRRAGIEFSREGRRILDAQTIYHKFEPRDLPAAYRKYCGKEMEKHHNSESDVRASFEVFKSQLEKHADLPRTINELHDFCNEKRSVNWIDTQGKFVWVDEEAVINFSKYKGRSISDIAKNEPGFLDWIIKNDFLLDTKEIASRALKGDFPKKG